MFSGEPSHTQKRWETASLHMSVHPRFSMARKFTMDANNAEHMGYLAGLQTPDGMFHLISSALHYQFNLAWLKAPMPAE